MSSIISLFLLLIGGFCLFALCSNLVYWYETLNTPEERIPAPLPNFRSCLYQYGVTLLGYLLCVGLYPFGPFLRRKVEEGRSAPPVLCVHGLNNNASVWYGMARVMGRAGYSVSTYSYSSFSGSLESITAGLDAHIQRIESAFPGRKPVVVCHSLGGLLVRHWLARGNNGQRLAGVITCGTPHKGSKLAVFAPGWLARMLLPGSAFLQSLENTPIPSCPCVSMVSSRDEAVLPACNLLPPEGWTMRVTDRTGHFSTLFAPSTQKAILAELATMHSE